MFSFARITLFSTLALTALALPVNTVDKIVDLSPSTVLGLVENAPVSLVSVMSAVQAKTAPIVAALTKLDLHAASEETLKTSLDTANEVLTSATDELKGLTGFDAEKLLTTVEGQVLSMPAAASLMKDAVTPLLSVVDEIESLGDLSKITNLANVANVASTFQGLTSEFLATGLGLSSSLTSLVLPELSGFTSLLEGTLNLGDILSGEGLALPIPL